MIGIFEKIISVAKQYESPIKVWAAYYCLIVIDDPNDLQIILNSPDSLEKADAYRIVPFGGLVTDPGYKSL